VEGSPARQARLREHYREWQRRIEATPFEPLGLEVDHVLLRLHLDYQLRLLEREEAWRAEAGALLPFAGVITGLEDARLAMEPLDPREGASMLHRLAADVDGMRRAATANPPARLTAFRAQETLERHDLVTVPPLAEGDLERPLRPRDQHAVLGRGLGVTTARAGDSMGTRNP
jgi:hypothetical protein